MKIIYVVGLEHSGTTLTDHLLSTHPNILGLGEVASFFSPEHMRQYIDKWGKYPDVSLCSCKKDWRQCDFWGPIAGLCGLDSDTPILTKYQKLFSYIEKTQGEKTVIVDSSKSIATLKMLVENTSNLGISHNDIFVIFAIKDVRSFAAS